MLGQCISSGRSRTDIGLALARDCPSFHDAVWVVDSTPVECGRSRDTAQRSDLVRWATYGYCASHSRWFWGLRLHLITTPSGLPMAYALTSAKADERDTCLEMIAHADITQRGQTLIADKGYRRASFEDDLNTAGIALIRPAAKTEPPRPGRQFLRPLRQIIESANWTLKSQLSLHATAAAPAPASPHAYCNEYSRSPQPFVATKPPTNPAPPDPSPPTTTDPLELII